MRGQAVKRLGLVLAALGVGMVALELSADRWFPIGGVVYRADDVLLHDARPNAARIQPMPAENVGPGDAARVFVSTGAEGYRGASLDQPKTRPRVLVMGDSLVMAENVPDQSTFVRQLGRALERECQLSPGAIETVNAGRSGYGPDQALLLLERDGRTVAPDLVVIVLCAHNDLGDLMRNKLFRLGTDGALEACQPFLGDRMRGWFRSGHAESERLAIARLWDFYRGPKAAPDQAPPSAIELYLAALHEQFEDHVIRKDREVVSLFEDIYDADVALGVDASIAIKSRLMNEIAQRASRFCAEDLDGTPLRFVIVPSAVDVCEAFDIRVDPKRHPGYDPSRLGTTMATAVASAGQPSAFDLTETLASAGDTDSLFVGGTDIHWNAAGQRLCADAVAVWLAGDGSVRPGLVR